MARGFHNFLIVSMAAHLAVFFVLLIGWENEPMPLPTKITYIRLSKGLGGTNLTANMGDEKGMPQNTAAEQKEALKQLAKLKELPKKKPQPTLPPPDTKIGKETAQPPPNKKTIKIGTDKEKTAPKLPATKTDSALAKINERLHAREQSVADIKIGTGQSKGGESGQSPWGGATGDDVSKDLVAYFNRVRASVSSSWSSRKGAYQGKTLTASITVRVSGGGGIVSSSFARTSGNGSFDEATMRAVRSARLPAPPASIRADIMSKGFRFVFTPRGVSGSM